MAEAAVPTLVFTVTFLLSKDLRFAVVLSLVCAGLLLVARLVQRQTPQFVLNALVGIGIGAFFAWRAARGGGDANDQALAYFLPGLIYNSVYAVLLVLSTVVRWPLVGFMVGSVTGDPTAWHDDPQVVRLCGRLTLLLAAPCLLRVVVQAPLYVAGRTGAMDPDAAVGVIAGAKLAMGWPLQVVALLGMVWLLTRNKTPRAEA
ncbi:DUF3159 domain-containing protein [Nocardioides mangrovicus]|uniref:DUF3159 domain-containing protein n=2 Tax=Nocardioides mangrovicus TaxID=2478913 RepID=A0A3L8P245_9ACTN|nr:DUF3159 domain-containing protein [Nocardioides mangrovicus]